MSSVEAPLLRSTRATTASATSVSTNITAETAAISGRSPTRSELKIYTGQGVAPGTCTKLDTIVLSRLSVKDIRAPAQIAGLATGRVICQKRLSGGA